MRALARPDRLRPAAPQVVAFTSALVLCTLVVWADRGLGASRPKHSARAGLSLRNNGQAWRKSKPGFRAWKHEEMMRRAICNARLAGVEKRTGGAFGAVIANGSGEVVAEGSNHVIARFDPTWHAEMEAIRSASAKLKSPSLEGCVLYSSSEPCPMCLAAAYWANLDGIVFAATAADSKKYGGFDDAFIYQEVSRPLERRKLAELQILREDALKVWKEYAADPK